MGISKPESRPFQSTLSLSLVSKEMMGEERVFFNRKMQAGQANFSKRKKTQYILPYTCLKNVHTMRRQLFAGKNIPEIPFADHIKYFLESLKILTKDTNI